MYIHTFESDLTIVNKFDKVCLLISPLFDSVPINVDIIPWKCVPLAYFYVTYKETLLFRFLSMPYLCLTLFAKPIKKIVS